ncbi:hypothetical protein L6452_19825 [Arctium lappa]|uniref:Uncharacterized protein n=1 Tax=Arctium lappa TaxID=4217 RepID=A0ACB9B9R4_ARCLA|nr:hypothetical protein L6452_19825 [Arctium lappa]
MKKQREGNPTKTCSLLCATVTKFIQVLSRTLLCATGGGGGSGSVASGGTGGVAVCYSLVELEREGRHCWRVLLQWGGASFQKLHTVVVVSAALLVVAPATTTLVVVLAGEWDDDGEE